MKKIRNLIVLSALAITMILAFTLTSSAQTTFKDVKVGAWYYDAVSEAVDEGIFTGTSDTTFSPNGSMTRAMFVTTLARMNDVDVSAYTEVSFSDVKPGSWYAPYVEWAYSEGITSGIGGGKFGVNNTITRQEMVALFYKSAGFAGESTEIPNEFKYGRSADAADVADWAVDGMKWALANSVISGTGNEGTALLLSPMKTATRAEAAQLIVNYLNFLKQDEPYISSLTINGNPIENYKVVYADNKESKNAAKMLVKYIERCTGITLTMTTDAEYESDYEILIGKTNRENGIVTVDRDGEDRCSFEISVQGNYLVIAGKDDNYTGSEFGVIGICKELLGFGFYTEGISTIERQDSVDIPDGYLFKDEPGFESRIVYWSNNADENRTGEPFEIKGRVHNLAAITGVEGKEPCLTDPEIIEHSINTVKGYLEADPSIEMVWVSQNDSPLTCMCDRCLAIYREEGSRGATLMLLCDTIAKEIEKDYPDCSILTLAYLHTTQPIKSKLNDNVVIYYCTLENCASHDYNDPNCPLNASILNHMEAWKQVCSRMWVWDYSANFSYSFASLPLVESLRDNREWFYSVGVRGEFNNAITGTSGEFGKLTAYLLGILQWEPTMSEDEYHAEIYAFLEAYYGAGWKYIRNYIDTIELLSEKNHFGYHAAPHTIIDYEDLCLYMDTFEGWWDSAEAYAESDEELLRIQTSRISWTYTMLTAMYTRDYLGSDSVARQAYIDLANEFYEEAMTLGVKWNEKETAISFDVSMPPSTWLPPA